MEETTVRQQGIWKRLSMLVAILMMVLLSIFLRAKDSPESKAVGAAHSDTGH